MDTVPTVRNKLLQEPDLVLVGADIEALYPSLNPIRTGEVIRKETQESEVTWKGVDWGECLKYLRMNLTPFKARTLGVSHLLPTRKFRKGRSPGITSENSLHKDKDHEDKWVSALKGRELSTTEQKLVMGCCLEIATVTLFTRHTYKFCGDIYLQQGGGPTGLSSSGSAADIRVTAWAKELIRILTKNGIPLKLIFAFVDDLRLALAGLKKGIEFCKMCKTLKITERQRETDNSSNENTTERTSRILKDIFNSIEPDLKFTVETQYDFEDELLPTLDTKIAMKKLELTSTELDKMIARDRTTLGSSNPTQQEKQQTQPEHSQQHGQEQQRTATTTLQQQELQQLEKPGHRTQQEQPQQLTATPTQQPCQVQGGGA